VPPNVAAAVGKALEKLPADRFASAKEFADALTNPTFASSLMPQPVAEKAVRPRGRFYLTVAAAVLLIATLGITAAWWRRPEPAPPLRTRFTIEVPDSMAVAGTSGQHSLVLAPDGSEIIYPGVKGSSFALYRRRLNDLAITQLSDGRALNPRYSPDGRWLGWTTDGKLMKVPVAGGSPMPLIDNVGRWSWGDEDVIVFSRGGALWKGVANATGAAQITKPDTTRQEVHAWPALLPGGKNVLFDIASSINSTDEAEVAMARLSDGHVTRLGIKGSDPRYLPSGHLLVAHRDGTILAVPFDLKTLAVRGEPVPVLENVFVKGGGAAQYAVSNNGVLAYIEGDGGGGKPIWIDPSGAEHPSGLASGSYSHLRVSPNGDRLAFVQTDAGRIDIWILTRATGQLIRLTRDGNNDAPEWSADGTRVGWIRRPRGQIIWQNADGSGAVDTTTLGKLNQNAFAVAPNGKFLIVAGNPGVSSGSGSMTLVPLDSSIRGRVVVDARLHPLAASISPDSKWLAFASDETGRSEVYIANIENPTTRLQVSTDRGFEPLWLADGKTLLYRGDTRAHVVTFSFAPRVEITRQDSLPTPSLNIRGLDRGYDVSRKTGELVALRRGDTRRDRIVVVTGWFEELRSLMNRASAPPH
jgi:serine/threonine-protein kinase